MAYQEMEEELNNQSSSAAFNIKIFFTNSRYWLVVILALVVISLFAKEKIALVSIITAIGVALSGLKYKLDRANYHKDLFEKRFEIYLYFNKTYWSWLSNKKTTDKDYESISGEIIHRAYFLFDKKTYNFIVDLRTHLLNCHEDNERFTKEREDSDIWLKQYADSPEEFNDKFKNLNIQFY